MFQKRWFRTLFRHRFYIVVLLILQVLTMVYFILSTSKVADWVYYGLTLLSFFVALHIVSRKDKGANKLTWVFVILLLPVLGGLMYLMFMYQSSTKRFQKRLKAIQSETKQYYALAEGRCTDARTQAPGYETHIGYLEQCAHFPAFAHTQTEFFSPGEAYFEALLRDVSKAEKYVFLEYFIVQEGKMWNSILDVLFEKAAQGVDVRLIYDDMGCFLLLPKDYVKFLKKHNIKAHIFNPFRPFLSTVQNNRDHRKIAVIDGKVAYTGGINLADEYINAIEKHGHWKDTGVRLEGSAAWSFTVMFLQMWELCAKEKEDYAKYLPEYALPESDGISIPYTDSPLDSENVGEQVYLQIINSAKRYLYINTPYLIIDDSMVSALCLAAKSGVDVRIVTPHIWDRKFVHFTTRSFYRELISAGVRVYEYTPGFVHAKTFVCDDAVATVGTVNLDFRSLYLHFECGVWMYKSHAVEQVYTDFINTLPKCQEITLKDCKVSPIARFFEEIFRLFSPLM